MPDAELVKTCEAIAAENGCTVKCTEDVYKRQEDGRAARKRFAGQFH